MTTNQSIPKGARAAVAMSGGVDSSVVAALLLQQGAQVIGITMQHRQTGQERDLADAKTVCANLGIEHRTINIAERYQEFLQQEIRLAYASGITPNPCVLCNAKMKFGFFWDTFLQQEKEFGADYFLASGHYAQIFKDEEGFYYPAKSARAEKDQSYFLYRLNQNQLSRIRFPLGAMTKRETRQLATGFGLSVREKPESQDFCLGSQELRPPKEPAVTFVDASGAALGKGKGISCYTIGQRRGLGLSNAEPLYVTALNGQTCSVTVGPEQDLFKSRCVLKDVVCGKPLDFPLACRVKIRSASMEQPAVAQKNAAGTVEVHFKTPQRALTPGQSAVFYNDFGMVLGGGFIDKVL